jgi:putative peptidoglycan lipid II flippase
MDRQLMRKKTVEVATSTMMSRLLGLVREVMIARYLGVGIIADAFITAFKIPNSLRKVFAEGALSAALVPTFVMVGQKDNKKAVSELMTLSMIIFQSVLAVLCVFIYYKAEHIIRIIVPGWFCISEPRTVSIFGIRLIDNAIGTCIYLLTIGQANEQALLAVSYLRILIPFILFLSMSALLASALQSVHHFFVPAFGQVLINIIFITGIGICMLYRLPVSALCIFILASGAVQLLWHLQAYFKLGFGFGQVTSESWQAMKRVLHKFIPCLLSMSVMELLLFVSTSVASFLPAGSIALIYYANRFMGIPLGIFSRAFSTVLFPYFAKVGAYAHKRLSFYLFEAAKLIYWVMVPVSLMLACVAEKLFLTLFLSKKFTIEHVYEAKTILIVFIIGLLFFSLNHILLNLYYALHETRIPLVISIIVLIIDIILSYFLLMPMFGAPGIAMATVIVSMMQTVLFAAGLYYFFDFAFYWRQFFQFALRASAQLMIVGVPFAAAYWVLTQFMSSLSPFWAHFLLATVIFWIWFIPLGAAAFFILFKTRSLFGIRLYFLE